MPNELTPARLDELATWRNIIAKRMHTITDQDAREVTIQLVKDSKQLETALRAAWSAMKIWNQAWVCTNCCAPHLADTVDPSWRWGDSHWQHKCPDHDPQCGHFPAEVVDVGELLKENEELRKELESMRAFRRAKIVGQTHHSGY